MSSGSGPSLRSAVLTTRERLRNGREKIRLQHESGTPGPQISALMTDLVDGIVLDLWRATLENEAAALASNVCLVATGGYGRRDLAPYSDVDLMLIPTAQANRAIEPLARRLTQDIVDAGMQLGFTVRTRWQAAEWAWRDPTIFTALAESRWLGGSMNLYQRYFNALRRGTHRRQSRLLAAMEEARREEQRKWGDTNYLLRPNVKRSRGALRDIQFIRWTGFACFGETDLERLVKTGELPEDDYQNLRAASSFLLRLRNELHFTHKKNQDVLDRPTQMQIAERWGYQADEGRLPVEHFMGEYFEHTRNVRYAVAHFVATARRRPLLTRSIDFMLSRQMDPDIRLGPYHLWVDKRALPAFAKDLPSVLRLMDLSNRYRRRIAHQTWQEIRRAMQLRPPGTPDEETTQRFLSLLSRPGRLAPLLRRLHELRVLEKIIPAMKHARGLLQFNDYHKYTVDAHSIRAVDAATKFENAPGRIGDIYRRIKDKRLLHLTLLIHDLGKGYPEEHSEVGARIARETGELLGLDKESIELIAKLVKLHLVVNHVALRHDLSDPEVVSKFAATVGTPRVLDLLTVHAVADLAAVGPGVLTEWKQGLIEDLYKRTREYFLTGHLPGEPDPETEKVRERIEEILAEKDAPSLSHHVLQSMPAVLLQREPAEEVAEHLLQVGELDDEGTYAVCWHRYLPDQDATEYTLVRRQGRRLIGTFARATGAFTAAGLEIQRAEIETLEPDLVWDSFVVKDWDFAGEPPESRSRDVCKKIREAVEDETPRPPTFRRVWKSPLEQRDGRVEILPDRVLFDNETFERYTVLSLFAYDRPGLLYSVAQQLVEHNLVLHFAKISTHLDQVVDVFYVTELDGSQLLSESRQEQIRTSLLSTVSAQADADSPS